MNDQSPTRVQQMVASPLATHPLAPDGSNLVLVEWADQGGGFSPMQTMAPRHVHHEDDEAFYVLEGALAFELNGETVELKAGDAVMIPHGTIHTWWNPHPEPCRYLILVPRRLHELIEAIHSVDRETTSMSDLFRQYRSELTPE